MPTWSESESAREFWQGTHSMLKMKLANGSFLIALSMGLGMSAIQGCATTPALEALPVSRAQRSSTLPKGVSVWKPFFLFAHDADPGLFGFPMLWEQGVAERTTLIWMPLPLHLRHRLTDLDEADDVSVEFAFLGPMRSRAKDFDWRPRVSLAWQKTMTSDWKLGATLVGQFEVRRFQESLFAYWMGLELRSMHELSGGLTLQPQVGAYWEKHGVKSPYFGSLPSSTEGLRFPVGLEFAYRFSRRLEGELELQWLTLGWESGYSSLPVTASLSYFW